MSFPRFDAFVLEAATRHGRLLYIVFAVLAYGIAFAVGLRMGRRKSVVSDFTSLFAMLLSALFLFLAFASLVGEFPKQLWFSVLAISVAAWLAQRLLIWAAIKSEVEFDIEKVSQDQRIVRAIVTAGSPIWIGLAGLLTVLLIIPQFGLLIYCGFLYDPAQMADATYRGEIAVFFIVLPAALAAVNILISQTALLASKYTTPASRNLTLVSAVGGLAGNLVLTFVPLYFYRDGLPSIAPILPTPGMLALIVGGAFIALLIIPYMIGALANQRFTTNLRASLLALIDRAEELSKRPHGNRREQEEGLLQEKVIHAYTPLARNRLLFYFALKLLEIFGARADTDATQKPRLLMLRRLSFGNEAPFEGNPLGEIAQIRATIVKYPFYRYNTNVQEFFKIVENDLDAVAPAHPLLHNFRSLTTILGALVDDIPDQERRYTFGDQRKVAAGQKRHLIKQTLPAWVLAVITTCIVSPFSEALKPKMQVLFQFLVKAVFGPA
jgi:hypothetical protein